MLDWIANVFSLFMICLASFQKMADSETKVLEDVPKRIEGEIDEETNFCSLNKWTNREIDYPKNMILSASSQKMSDSDTKVLQNVPKRIEGESNEET